MSDIAVTVIDSHGEWLKIEHEWNLLLKASGSDSVFLTYEWLSAWAKNCIGRDRTLFILAFHEKGSLVGIAPFYVQRTKFGPCKLREIRFIGSPEAGSDYLDVFTRRGREGQVANALYDFLMGEWKNDWDCLFLQDIPADALFLLNFSKRIKAEGKYFEILQSAYCPQITLPRTDAEYFEMLSSETRKGFKRNCKGVNLGNEVIYSVKQGEEALCYLDEFLQFYEEKGGWPGSNLHSILHDYINRCSNSNPVQINLLSTDSRMIAALLQLNYHNSLACYLISVDKGYNPKISLGNLLIGLCINNAIGAGRDTFDFLKGDEAYKFHWANGGKSTLQLVFWQKRPVSVASALARLVRYAGKLIVR